MKRWLIVIALCLWIIETNAQCSLVPSSTSGCIPHPVSFNLTNSSGKSVKSYSWKFGDGDVSTEANPTHVYDQRGTYQAEVTLTFSDNSTCTAKIPNSIRIYDNPDAKIDLPAQVTRCHDNRFIRMEHSSTRSLDNGKIINFTWDYGDGSSLGRSENPYHQFQGNGTFNVVLEIQDEFGCKDTAIHPIDVLVLEKLDPQFIKHGRDSCPVTRIKYVNRTDSAGKLINKITWDFGDGTTLSATKGDPTWDNVWNSAQHIYTKDGVFEATLTLENVLGCREEITKFNINNVVFWFNIKASPDSVQCFNWRDGGNRVIFSNPTIPNANSTLWEFGDGDRQSLGFTAYHTYTTPGSYTVSLTVRVRGCERDTTVCDMVQIKGPVAKIQRFPEQHFDSLVGYPFFPNPFPNPIDTCQGIPVEYYTLDTFIRKKSVPRYCNADTLDSTAIGQRIRCDGPETVYDYTLNPTSTIDQLEQVISREKHFWHPDTIPQEPVFSPYTGEHVDGNMHDTDLFSPNCSAPHTVDFTNNSIKYRLRDAVDDRPPGFHDECINPSYPFASDSLEYFWDFDDPFGKACTSSVQNPDILCSWSTERLPKHTYTVDGCYYPKLRAFDPVTNCEAWDSVKILLEPPFAAWDSTNLKVTRMDFDTQQKLRNSSYLRGMKMLGLKCTETGQTLRLDEIRPQCGPHDFWVLPDSAAMTRAIPCGVGNTIYQRQWIDMAEMESRNYLYTYDTEGWKSVGLVVKSGMCYDTFWYHKYKYVYHLNSSIKASAPIACPNQPFYVTQSDTSQEGVRFVYYQYLFKKSASQADSLVYTDTIGYINHLDQNGNLQEITSSLHNPESGVEDDTVYNNLSEKSWFQFGEPGHITLVANVEHRFGCQRQSLGHIGIGHFARFSTEHRTYCLGDSVHFIDSVRYFQEFTSSYLQEGVEQIDYWRNPWAGRPQLPEFPERVAWDFDGDSIIDHEGPRPSFVYTEPGLYTVRMFTKDSLNCDWQVLEKKDFIKVVGVDAKFSVLDDDSVRFCAPHFFEFEDKSQVLQPNHTPRDTIVKWSWKWGDETNANMTTLPNGKAGKSYAHNGYYRVHLTVTLGTYDTTKGTGCVDTTSKRIYIEGPRPKFTLVGDSVGCVPFTTTVQDMSTRASVWEWQLGDGSTKPSFGEELVDLHYKSPGIYCITLAAGDTIKDLNDSTFYCVDKYPHEPCKYKVRVLPKDPLVIEHDSILCLDEEGTFDLSKSDEAYTSFNLDFGDGIKDSGDTAIFYHSYPIDSSFWVNYSGQSRCPDTGKVQVNVLDIIAQISMDSSRLDTPSFWFNNTSLFGERYDWLVNGEISSSSDLEPINYTFTQTGTQEICLIAENIRGCRDTACITVNLDKYIFIPNVFTPDDDAFNSHFNILIRGHSLYDLQIFNRWGEKVFESSDKYHRWNGRRNNTGAWCETGTYFYVFKYQLLGEEPKLKGGTVTLLR